MQRIVKDFFVYSTGRFQVPQGTTVVQNIPIQADADFLVDTLSFAADIAGVAQTLNNLVIPNFSVVITDTGSGRQLMNIAIPLLVLFGTGNFQKELKYPRLFNARSNIQIVTNSFEAAIAPFISLNFIGCKIFQVG